MIDSVQDVGFVSGAWVQRRWGVVAVVLVVSVWGFGAGSSWAQVASGDGGDGGNGADGEIELFLEGLNWGDGPFPEPGSEWLALVVRPDGAELVPTVVEVEEVGTELELFLSSAAAPGDLVGLAARYIAPGC